MAQDAGKYDDACTAAREATDAQSVVLIVVQGTKGNGFSVQTADPHFNRSLPAILRAVADKIEGAKK